MGIAKGKIGSVIYAKLEKPKKKQIIQIICDMHFVETENTTDELNRGFTKLNMLHESPDTTDHVFDHIVASFRTDKKSVSKPYLKAETEKKIKQLMKEGKIEKVSALKRTEIRESIKLRLLAQMHPKTKEGELVIKGDEGDAFFVGLSRQEVDDICGFLVTRGGAENFRVFDADYFDVKNIKEAFNLSEYFLCWLYYESLHESMYLGDSASLANGQDQTITFNADIEACEEVHRALLNGYWFTKINLSKLNGIIGELSLDTTFKVSGVDPQHDSDDGDEDEQVKDKEASIIMRTDYLLMLFQSLEGLFKQYLKVVPKVDDNKAWQRFSKKYRAAIEKRMED